MHNIDKKVIKLYINDNYPKIPAEQDTLVVALIAENKALRQRLEESEKILQIWYKNAI
jgi:predicted transcriptional regulator